MILQQYWAGIATRPGTRQEHGWAISAGYDGGSWDMSESGRRDALRFLGAGALLSVANFSFPALAQLVRSPRRLPQGQYCLTRIVERELIDGAILSVMRSWSCRFEQAGRGMRVVGEALECLVDAPGGLEPLAALEKQRKDAGPFPALLDGTGLIATQSSSEPVDQRLVIDTAISVLKNLSPNPLDLDEARMALTRMANAAGKSLGVIPRDLFFPDTEPQKLTRIIELAPDVTGQVELNVVSEAQPATGLLASRERRLVTRIGEDERVAREVWKLDPA